MEKVKITQEQAEVLESVKCRVGNEENIVRMHVDKSIPWGQEEYEMNEFNLDDLIKALYIGYEVEPKFKKDDYVVIKKTGEVAKIKAHPPAFPYPDYLLSCNGYFTSHHVDELRHATKQEIWWFESDRDFWEIREDDTLKYIGDLYIVDWFDSENVGFKSINENAGKFVEILDYVKEHFTVFCFAEDRKDI